MSRQSLKNVMRLIDVAHDNTPIEKSFLSDLKRSIELEAGKERRKGSNYYKPSSMNCIRSMFYVRTNANADTSNMSYTGVGICNAGTDIHERIQGYVSHMIDNGMPCEYVDVGSFIKSRGLKNVEIVLKTGYETKLFHKTLNMSFMLDGIIKYKDKYFVLEIKSETASKWIVRDSVDVAHYKQATAYSIATELDNVIFIYVNRDTLDMKAFLFTPADDMKEDFIGLIEECEEHVKKLLVPNKSKDVTRKTCQYCNYASQCRKDA